MREQLELLRTMGVKSARVGHDGKLLEVEFFPSEPPALDVSDAIAPGPTPLESAYMQAVNAVRGVKNDGNS